MKHAVTASAAALLVSAASAGPIFYFAQDSGGIIEDGPFGETAFTADVFASGVNFEPLVVYLDIQHTWVGDLTVTLEHNGVEVTLLDRLGFPDSTNGSNDDLSGVYQITAFSQQTLDGFDNAGTDSIIPPGFYRESNTDGSSLEDLLGGDIFGEWNLTIRDAAGFDVGVLNEWRVGFIPAPGAAGLLGLAALAAARRRR